MDTTAQEIRQAARRLVRTPVFTLAAALTLALAIAANASIFTVVHRVVLNPLPYPESSRLIALDYGFPARGMRSGLTSMAWQLYYQLADHARTLEGVAKLPVRIKCKEFLFMNGLSSVDGSRYLVGR